MKHLIIVMLLALISNNLFAGYENTKWGMSLDEVKKIYPDGHINTQQSGVTSYSLAREIAEHPNAYLVFSFGDDKKLKSVNIMFPEHGSKINFQDNTFDLMKNEKCNYWFKKLNNKLVEKYGSPILKNTNSASFVISNDSILLAIIKQDDKHCTAMIGYGPLESSTKAKLKGL